MSGSASASGVSLPLPRMGELRPWLRRLAQEGHIKICTPNLLDEAGGVGAMTDAPKRAKPDSTSVDDFTHVEPWEMPGYQKQTGVPVAPEVPKKVPVTSSPLITLPPGVKDVACWGKTLCSLPKFKSSQLSYEEMAKDKTKEMKDYLQWILDNSSKSAKTKDFANYLRAVRWGESDATAVFPGSNEPRVLKD